LKSPAINDSLGKGFAVVVRMIGLQPMIMVEGAPRLMHGTDFEPAHPDTAPAS
jgi:hypothetical protein